MPRASPPNVLGTMSPEGFLKKYWQKEPCVFRNAFPGLVDPLAPDELAGLSCEAGVDSRLVIERGGKKPWLVVRGPQRAATLRKLPRSHWTLLVESVDRHNPEIAALASAFRFLPRWRMDDVMVSLAPEQGTVDAHIDSYDVFLIQGQGRRRWEIDRKAAPHYKAGLDLRILRRFRPEESWVLEPGDMLYVPPGVGHRGVTVKSAVEIALTYSIGFRAPSTSDLLASLLATHLKGEPRLFADPGRVPVADSGELGRLDLAALKDFLIGAVDGLASEAWIKAAGEAVTAGGGGAQAARRMSPTALARSLEGGAILSPVPSARVAWARLRKNRAILFVNGESRVLEPRQAFAAALLCGANSPKGARRLAANAELLRLVVDLNGAGVLALTAPPSTPALARRSRRSPA